MTLSVRMSPEEEALIKEFAETYDISVSSLIRTSVLEKIENEIDVNRRRCQYSADYRKIHCTALERTCRNRQAA